MAAFAFPTDGIVKCLVQPRYCGPSCWWSLHVYAQQRQALFLGDVARSHVDGAAQADCAADDPRGIRGIKHFAELAHSPLTHSREIRRRAFTSWYHTDSGRYESAALLVNLPFALLLMLGIALITRGRCGGGGRTGTGLLHCSLGRVHADNVSRTACGHGDGPGGAGHGHRLAAGDAKGPSHA